MDSSTHRALFVPGSVIADRYQVIDTVGKGGMGIVMRVNDRALNNEVIALKLLYPHMATDQTQFARFQNEVLVARKLAHPNIVRLFDFGSAGQGYYYITMEYIEGGSLGQRIYGPRHQRMSLNKVLQALLETCAGLSCAHALGIVHRDLKPDNILLTVTGAIKLSDFGLARTVGTDRGLTQTGDIVGTPYYMAPEQLRGERPDHRVDIYALGILTYELVVGLRPFVHDNYLQLAGKHFNDPIPKFAAKDSGIPPWLQEFVERASAKRKEDRFQSADEAAHIISAHLSEATDSAVHRAPAVLSLYSAEHKGSRAPGIRFSGAGLVALGCVMLVGAIAFYRGGAFANISSERALSADASIGLTVKDNFFKQIVDGQIDYVQMIINNGDATPNDRDANGIPALHRAVLANQGEIAKLLLIQQNVEPDITDPGGLTALDLAIQQQNKEMASILRKFGLRRRRIVDPQRPEVKAGGGPMAGTAQPAASSTPAVRQTLQLRKGSSKVRVVPAAAGVPGRIEFSVWNSSHYTARDLKLRVYDGPKLLADFLLGKSVERNEKLDLQVIDHELNHGDFERISKKQGRIRFKVSCSNCDRETDLD